MDPIPTFSRVIDPNFSQHFFVPGKFGEWLINGKKVYDLTPSSDGVDATRILKESSDPIKGSKWESLLRILCVVTFLPAVVGLIDRTLYRHNHKAELQIEKPKEPMSLDTIFSEMNEPQENGTFSNISTYKIKKEYTELGGKLEPLVKRGLEEANKEGIDVKAKAAMLNLFADLISSLEEEENREKNQLSLKQRVFASVFHLLSFQFLFSTDLARAKKAFIQEIGSIKNEDKKPLFLALMNINCEALLLTATLFKSLNEKDRLDINKITEISFYSLASNAVAVRDLDIFKQMVDHITEEKSLYRLLNVVLDYKERLEFLELLVVEKKLDVNTDFYSMFQNEFSYQGDDATPLKYAIHHRNLEGAKWLIKRGARCDLAGGENLNSPLSVLAVMGHFDGKFLDFFFEQEGVEINKRWMSGYTALHEACYSGSHLFYRKLIEKGADPLLPNDHGKTPVQMALGYESSPRGNFLKEALKDFSPLLEVFEGTEEEKIESFKSKIQNFNSKIQSLKNNPEELFLEAPKKWDDRAHPIYLALLLRDTGLLEAYKNNNHITQEQYDMAIKKMEEYEFPKRSS